MAGDRTLKLTLLAETKQLIDGLKKSAGEVEDFGKQVADISAKAVKAFAAIGLAVGAASLAFAKAAAEDQASANRLAQTLASLTNATNKQIDAVAQYIDKTELATGIADDELRPAFERLARSTKNVEQSQTLLNLALDISAATGKPLEAVTNALAKAYDGSYTSLQKMGLGIDANIIKTKDFDKLYAQLNGTLGDFSEKRSEEAIIKFERLQRAIGQAKEQIGAALLPLFEKLGDWLLNEGVPRLNAFIAGLTGDRSLSAGFTEAQKQAEAFGQKIRSIIETVLEYKSVVIGTGAVVGTVFAVSNIAQGVAAVISTIQALIKAYNALKASAAATAIAQAFALNPLLGAVGAGALIGLITYYANKASNDVSGLESLDVLGGAGTQGKIGMGGGAAGAIGSGGGGGFSGSFAGAAGGGGTTAKIGGFGSVDEMFKRLQDINTEIGSLTFKYKTGQISKSEAQKAVDALQKEMTMIERAAGTLGAGLPTGTYGAFQPNDASRVTYGGGASIAMGAPVVINVNAPSVIDETGFARAVQRAIQASEDRGTYTGGL